jgi:hypothetical protein
MANWVLEDSMLAPREKIEINFRGPNPFGIYKKMDSAFFQKTLEVGSTDIWEREFRWTAGSDPHPFFIRIFVHRGFDRFTDGYFEILFQGRQPSDPSKDGSVRITLGGNLRTEFKLSTPFQQTPLYRGLLWIYNYLYYWRIRRGYLKICQEKIDLLSREIRSWTGMPVER